MHYWLIIIMLENGRESEGESGLHVSKVHVKDGAEFGRHFCSEVHAVEVCVKFKVSATYTYIVRNLCFQGPAKLATYQRP